LHIDILISTFDRLKYLKSCIQSIKNSDYKDVSILVAVDGNKHLLEPLASEPVEVVFNEERKDYVISMNKLLTVSKGDAILFASDDLEFAPNCISTAVRAMHAIFPDGDGVIGIRQQNRPGGSKSAFCLVGRKFINRFPNNQMFCPDYVHYASDTEVGEFAAHLGRFRFCREAKLIHLNLRDKTDVLARTVLKKDDVTRKLRFAKGLLWGKNFGRLGAGG